MVPIVDVECLKRCPTIAMVRLSRFQKPIISKRVVLKMSGKFIQPGYGK